MPLFILSSVLAVGACNKAPSEPHPDPLPTTASATTTAPPVTNVGGHCIAPLAQAAPAIPAAAGNACPADPQGRFKLARAQVTIPEAKASVDAELAKSSAEGERGLMFRKQMGEDEGMLFYIDEKKVQTFWMHNTCIPLDMLFIDDDGTLVGVVESAPVLDDGVREVDCPSRYVLEVNAGWTRRHGVKPGQRVVLPP
jgi:uncharacterized membrane protein (UPF0127 family)